MKSEFLLMIKPAREDFISTISPEEQEMIALHFKYLTSLKDQGILHYAGRCEDCNFGIALFMASSEQEAHELMAIDPAIRAGLFSFKIHSFHTAITA